MTYSGRIELPLLRLGIVHIVILLIVASLGSEYFPHWRSNLAPQSKTWTGEDCALNIPTQDVLHV